MPDRVGHLAELSCKLIIFESYCFRKVLLNKYVLLTAPVTNIVVRRS